jgi:hypothetical protein
MATEKNPGPLTAEVERDQYLAALYELTRKEFTFTPEELAELEKEGIPFEEVIAAVEKGSEK